MCPFGAEARQRGDVRRAVSQHGEIGRGSGCRGIGVICGGSRVVYEVEDALQTPPNEALGWLDVAAGQVIGHRTKAECESCSRARPERHFALPMQRPRTASVRTESIPTN